MSVGKRLKEARKGTGHTQDQVAGILGIDDTTISKYENDKSEVDYETLIKFSKLYKVNIHWLLTGQGEKKLLPADNSLLSKLSDEKQSEFLRTVIEKVKDTPEENQKFILEFLDRMKKQS